jgi:hypothetical protein
VGFRYNSKYFCAFHLKEPRVNQFINPLPGLKRGIHLDKGIRPQNTFLQVAFHAILDLAILYVDETLNVIGIILFQPVSQSKDVHNKNLSDFSALTV